VASEMMFGSKDRFKYRGCASCGCLELLNPPPDLSGYYPSTYYSMAERGLGLWVRYLLFPHMSRYWLGHPDLVGSLICRGRHRPPVLGWLGRQGKYAGSQLLDVGSGVGHLLFSLRGLGFGRLVGVDPFVARDLRFPGRITVLKRAINEVTGSFNYVVLNHSFEHMGAPLDVLKHVRRLLASDGQAMISTPIASSFAWRHYGVDWVQLDAPRHLFVHTEKSLRILADQAGLRVADVVYDSTEFQFWGSEQYRAGISLHDSRSYARSPGRSIFTREQIANFRRHAEELNVARDGDSASFYLESNRSTG
jgi:SAM-dependent methyltransferase